MLTRTVSKSVNHLSRLVSRSYPSGTTWRWGLGCPRTHLTPVQRTLPDDCNMKCQSPLLCHGQRHFCGESKIPSSGMLPVYDTLITCYKVYTHKKPFHLKYNNGILPELQVAYETFGTLNEDRSNAVIIHTATSGSSHVTSHEENSADGWWEKFVGPGCAIDTSKYFVICCNNLGSCYGTSGPSCTNPISGKPYGSTFPIIAVEDIVHSQFLVLDHLNIFKVDTSVGGSLGGMIALMAAALYPNRVGRVICISASARSYPTFISFHNQQRRSIMMDPNWMEGHYYGITYPRMGMKLAREIATITYRSGPEWIKRFGRSLITKQSSPTLGTYFMVEQYTEHQGESFSMKFDPNSLLYISRTADLFDMGEGFPSLEDGVSRVKCPIMVIGVHSDMVIPCWQQKELADLLRKTGNNAVTYYELDSELGHDTFLLDLSNIGGAIKGYLETKMKTTGVLRKSKL